MTLIPEHTIAEIRNRTDIVQIVGEVVPLRAAGGQNHKGLCPFHQEKSPSFNVNRQRGIYYCFGCHEGGDVFKFLMRISGRSFVEVAAELAGKAGVELPRAASPEEELRSRKREDERSRLLRVNEVSAEHWRALLASPAGAPARSYLEDRGVSEEIAATFGIGFSVDAWDELAQFLAAEKVPTTLAEKLGLIVPRSSSASQGGHYDRFRGRIMFPVYGLGGEIVAFGGRVIPGLARPQAPRAGEAPSEPPKYLNSPESSLYRKGAILYGLLQARQEIRRLGAALLVEGNLDVVMLHQAGLTHAVAPMGTALTVEQVEMLRRFCGRVVLCFDGDTAGRSKAFDAARILLAEGLDVRIATPPDGEDPDSWVRKLGADAVRAALDAADPAVNHFIKAVDLANDHSIPARARALDQLAPILALVRNPVERDLYVQRTGEVLGIEPAHVVRAVRSAQSAPVQGAGKPAQPAAPASASPVRVAIQAVLLNPFEAALLGLLAAYPRLTTIAEQENVQSLLISDGARLAFGALLSHGGDIPAVIAQLDSLPSEERAPVIQALLSSDFDSQTDPEHAFLETLARMRARRIKDRLVELDRELVRARATGDETRARELALSKHALQKERAALDPRESSAI